MAEDKEEPVSYDCDNILLKPAESSLAVYLHVQKLQTDPRKYNVGQTSC